MGVTTGQQASASVFNNAFRSKGENIIEASGYASPFAVGSSPETALSSSDVELRSGSTSGTSVLTGSVTVKSGNSSATGFGTGYSGPVSVVSGNTSANGSGSGNASLESGTSTGVSAPTGDVRVVSGDCTNTGATSGSVTVGSGNASNSSSSSGTTTIKSGSAANTSGDINIQVGASGSIRGQILLSAKKVQVTTADGLDMGSKKITSLLDPTLAQDAATKAYADAAPVIFNNGLSGATATLDLSTSLTQLITVDANVAFTLSNPVVGHTYRIILTQDSTGGWTYTWPGTVLWPSAVAPTGSAANKVDMVSLFWNGTNYFGRYETNY